MELVEDRSANALYFSDYSNNRVRAINLATGIITTLIGTGVASSTGTTIATATINRPMGLALDATRGLLYIAESLGNIVRRVNLATNDVSIFGGTGASGVSFTAGAQATSTTLQIPNGVAVDEVNNLVYITGAFRRVLVVDAATGVINCVAGTGITSIPPAGDNGQALSATLGNVQAGIRVDASNPNKIYFVET
jgi:sugar lactone lactonase YvrE